MSITTFGPSAICVSSWESFRLFRIKIILWFELKKYHQLLLKQLKKSELCQFVSNSCRKHIKFCHIWMLFWSAFHIKLSASDISQPPPLPQKFPHGFLGESVWQGGGVKWSLMGPRCEQKVQRQIQGVDVGSYISPSSQSDNLSNRS